jgi:MauM/NapG family ferredoxin protein
VPQWFRQAKYVLLFVIFSAALLSNLTFIFLDPLSLLTHTLTTLYSVLKLAVAAIQARLYGYVSLRESLAWLEPTLRAAFLEGYEPPAPRLSFSFAFVFAAVLAMNLLAKRFWCRYLCPLGALLGLLSKIAWLKRRVGEGCSRCGLCEGGCSMGTIVAERDFADDEGECILCLSCLTRCPQGAIGFERGQGPSWGYEYDLSRRQLLASLGAGVVGVAILRTGAARRSNPYLLRPPGAEEAHLLARCIRCGRCMKACPTSALQPSLLEAGWEGIWTPILVPRLGYCDYSCTACGQVCPTGAIPPLPLEVKRVKVIGTAYVDEARCIGCMVCEELCPVPEKAIKAKEVKNEIGEIIQLPYVVWDLCTGCGICEYICPVSGEAAIRVHAPAILDVKPYFCPKSEGVHLSTPPDFGRNSGD